MEFVKENINAINDLLKGKSAFEIITYFNDELGDKITFGTSLGAEDQVITQMLASINSMVPIFTLDTGRLFPQTYDLIDSTSTKYKIIIKPYSPVNTEVETMVVENGMNLFFKSIELRKHCCQVRKLRPLKRALEGRSAWFTGLRRSQSITRVDMQIVEWDENSNMLKVNPLMEWSEDDVWDYIKAHGIPYNPLHDQDYPSIGCQPCTRAIMPGEDVRAGRWSWENPDTRECGLHK
ncbi:MAG: phosphoadenosine phosphosulfate reductase [Bacteroidetes bacterium 4572_112]|nr:MAG: phosphoadenosine phosphosulfate reductase [Bacteroidetes bacterium 4572_112]